RPAGGDAALRDRAAEQPGEVTRSLRRGGEAVARGGPARPGRRSARRALDHARGLELAAVRARRVAVDARGLGDRVDGELAAVAERADDRPAHGVCDGVSGPTSLVGGFGHFFVLYCAVQRL